MKASELITRLQKIVARHGDTEVFSKADNDFIEGIFFDPEWEWDKITPAIILDSYPHDEEAQ